MQLSRFVKRRRLSQRHFWAALLFIAPAGLLLISITIYPLLRTLYLTTMSLEMSVSPNAQFVGFQNFVRIFSEDQRFWSAMGNTGILVVGGVTIQLVLGTALALILDSMRWWRSFWLSIMLMPVLIAPVVAGFQFRVIFNDTFGPLNYLIERFSGGLVSAPLWLADSDIALFSIMITDVWQWTPFMLLLVLSGLQTVPVEYSEAARVDGATFWQIFWRIQVPFMSPILAVAVLIRAMDAFNKSTFDLVYMLTGGGPGNATETAAFYTYLNGFRFFSLGYTAALALVQLVIIVAIATLFLHFMKRARGVA